MKRFWSEYDCERLAELMETGASYSEIARQLGRTKDAVSSRCKRLGLRRKPTEQPEPDFKPVFFVSDIIRHTAAVFGVPVEAILGPSRLDRFVRPRQCAQFLAREITGKSYPQIGAMFGGRNHSTVVHGVKLIAHLIERDPYLAGQIEIIRHLVHGEFVGPVMPAPKVEPEPEPVVIHFRWPEPEPVEEPKEWDEVDALSDAVAAYYERKRA